MMRVSRWILSGFAPTGEPMESPAVRMRAGLLEGWSSVVLNAALAVFKGILGLMTGSVSLLADAVHTLSDSLTSVVVIFGFRMSDRPADERHPFGHGRMEGLAAVVIGVLLAVAAVEMTQYAVERLIEKNPTPVHAETWVIASLIGTVALKEFQARFSMDLGKLIKSQALVADGLHHRSDVLATGLVIVALIAARWKITLIDGVAGIGVAVLIGWCAYETLAGAMSPLLGERAPEDMYEEIERIARAVPGVLGVHDVLVNRYGGMDIISLHIEVSATENVMHLHDMSEEIETKVRRAFPGHAIVHVDPLNTAHEHYDEVHRIVTEAVAAEKKIVSFHDLRLVGGRNRFKVVFDIAPAPGAKDIPFESFRDEVAGRIRAKFPRATVAIDLEPPYFHNDPIVGEVHHQGTKNTGKE
ncbi:MAG: cation diffusion facilitator family transporter [Candidatus Brocadiia bacterium]|jgi:cation diffusion facilitator family transporter